MRATMLTPLPPSRTGVAHYASILLPALRQRIGVEVMTSPTTDNRQPTTPIYQLGNNPHHAWIYEEAMRTPGVAVLHDVVLHHLIVEMTLAKGDVDGYVDALRASHGEPGAAWARGRAAGLHSEMGNFLMPASVEVANRSVAVIVHNRWAADLLRSLGVVTPIHVVGHPFEPQPDARARRDEIRLRHGFSATDRVVGLFGFLTSAKRAEVVLAAFARAQAREPRLRLLIVGEAAPDIDVATSGYVAEEDFAAYFAAVDRLVNLRYPSAGETSGTLIRAFEAGKPVAVSDYAQFAELPDDCVVKIPFGDREIDDLADFLVRDLPDPGQAQHRWLEENASIEKTVEGYLTALANVAGPAPGPGGGSGRRGRRYTFPLFPQLEATLRGGRIVIRNAGDFTVRTRTYGQPGYRLIVNGKWHELPRDLAPGEQVEIPAPADKKIRLVHGIQGLPVIDERPIATLELP
jgi:glycosyltransferase involved in cell wall biosynthesis